MPRHHAIPEELFLREVGETFLLVGTLRVGWEEEFRARLRSTRFLRPASDHQRSALKRDLDELVAEPIQAHALRS
jgi:hypothetical protein